MPTGCIQLQFSRQYDWQSGLIAWFTQGKFSHVDAVLSDGTLTGARSDWIGNKPAGVQNRPAHYAKWKYVSVVTLAVPEQQQWKFYDFLDSQLGKPYDKSAIWGIATGGRERDWRADDSWICSELITVALEIANIIPITHVSASKIAPDPLFFGLSIAGFVEAP